jgi:transposase
MVRAVLDGGLTQAEAARYFLSSAKTVGKLVGRFRAEGIAGLRGRLQTDW